MSMVQSGWGNEFRFSLENKNIKTNILRIGFQPGIAPPGRSWTILEESRVDVHVHSCIPFALFEF